MIIFRVRDEKENSANLGMPENLEEKDKNKRKIKIGLLIAVLIGIIVTIILKERGAISSDSDEVFNMAVFVPVWIAIFVPLLAGKNKKKFGNSDLSDEQKRISVIIGILFVLLAIGVFVFNFVK